MRVNQKTALTLGSLALTLAAGVTCSPAKPAQPSFATDAAPIFAAHCNRCHNSNGLQGDPGDPPLKPRACKFDFYEGDPATCAADGGATPLACWGAKYCAEMALPYITGRSVDPMPPPPASPLNDYELDVIERWIDNPIP